MTFDLQRILESKRALRHQLAALPLAEKLRLLDALRERALCIRPDLSPVQVDNANLREDPATYRMKPGTRKKPATPNTPFPPVKQ